MAIGRGAVAGAGPGCPPPRTSERSGGRGSALGHSCQIAVAGQAVDASSFFSSFFSSSHLQSKFVYCNFFCV